METEPPSQTLNGFFCWVPLLLEIPAQGIALSIVFLLVLLFCSAMISASEVAFFSLTHNEFSRLREERSGAAQRILLLKEKPRRLLATILISNNFVNIAIVLVADYLMRGLIQPEVFERWAFGLQSALSFQASAVPRIAGIIHFTITVVGVTFLLVLFGEVTPKVYARFNNLGMARTMSGPLSFLMQALSPLTNLMVRGTNLIERRLERRQGHNLSSKADIGNAIDLTVLPDSNSNQEIDLLKSIVKFGDTTVRQIMRSRVDIVAADESLNFRELLELVRESGYSRIPVFREDLDDIVGILYAKDLITCLQEPESFHWQELIRSNVIFVPETKKIDDMLRFFQGQRMHMAIVVDEFGGTAGLITLEDILEEVIGEIRDEFDDEVEVEYEKLDDQNFVFEGKTLLPDVCRIIGEEVGAFQSARGDADSLAGLVLELAGHLPQTGTEFSYGDFVFRVTAANDRRIEKIQITLPEKN